MIESFWRDYQIAIGLSVFVPFVIYAITINVFFSNFLTITGNATTPTFHILRVLSYIFTLIFSMVEIL